MKETEDRLRRLTDPAVKNNDYWVVKEFADLLTAPGTEAIVKNEMQKDWEGPDDGAPAPGKGYDHVLLKIHQQINKEFFQKQTTLHKIVVWYAKTAAVLLLPLLGWWGSSLLKASPAGQSPATVKIISPLGARVQSTLPDGTRVWLNSGSTLEYSYPFAKREVTVKGEAFFEVVADHRNPFRVNGPYASVTATGTAFNVTMWAGEDLTEVVLAKGSVKMQPHGRNESYLMDPGDLLVYDQKRAQVARKAVKPEHYSAWREGKLVLRDQNMEEVARELSRWFNVEVEIRNGRLKEYNFHATFEDEKLEDVLRLLRMTLPLDYEIINNQQQKDGSFTRKKVIIK
ncbi:MAG: DUF4974 domain-containing protein [Breznakibacter sp.]